MDMERRSFPVEVEIEEGEAPKIRGYAAVFNAPSEDLGYTERIRPGAFADTIQADDIRALWNHDPNYVLGRNTAGTLSLTEDDHGLWIEVAPPDAQWARDLTGSIKRGDISQMSFGFYTQADEWNADMSERELVKVQLFDVSPVTFPAYTQTSVGVRNLGDVEKLDGAVERAKRGEETDEDKAIIREAIDNLEGSIADEEVTVPAYPSTLLIGLLDKT